MPGGADNSAEGCGRSRAGGAPTPPPPAQVLLWTVTVVVALSVGPPVARRETLSRQRPALGARTSMNEKVLPRTSRTFLPTEREKTRPPY